jgi:hypothetical protein
MSAPNKIEVIAESLARGFSFGPRSKCASCGGKCGDPEQVDRGICERCWTAIEAHEPAMSAAPGS